MPVRGSALPILMAADAAAVLAGHDRDSKFVFGIGVKTKSVVKWAMRGVQKGETVQLMTAFVEWLQEQKEDP